MNTHVSVGYPIEKSELQGLLEEIGALELELGCQIDLEVTILIPEESDIQN